LSKLNPDRQSRVSLGAEWIERDLRLQIGAGIAAS